MKKAEPQYDLIVVGGGPAGLAAAYTAWQNGLRRILVVERDRELGGILNQCIHTGFGLEYFKEELTGPEYAGRFIRLIKDTEIETLTDTMALQIEHGTANAPTAVQSEMAKTATLAALHAKPGTSDAQTEILPKIESAIPGPAEGNLKVHISGKSAGYAILTTKSVILATGCRERARGAAGIPGSRPAGVITAGAAQRYVNMEGYLPGKRIVIIGSGDVGLIMARRMTLEGAEVLACVEMMPKSSGLTRNIVQCLHDNNIPLLLSHAVTDIKGKTRVESVTVSEIDADFHVIEGTEKTFECDTVLLSVGLIPENELANAAGVILDGEHVNTSVDGIFACGNALHVHDIVDNVTLEANKAGAAAAKYIL